jgi:hypothetical protein
MIFFDVKCRLEGFLRLGILHSEAGNIDYVIRTQKEDKEGKNVSCSQHSTLRGFKVDGLFFHATLLFIFDLVKRDIFDRFPTTTESEPGTEVKDLTEWKTP